MRFFTARIRSFDDAPAATPYYPSTLATAILAPGIRRVVALIVTRNAICITDDSG